MRTTQRRQVCVLLPNKQHLDCTVRARARGHEVLNSVLKQLFVSELQVFGLAVLRDNEYLFLDLEQKLSKYFGKRWRRGSLKIPFILFLRVQYYVESGRLILSSKIQQLYYAELRQKVLLSQSRHQESLFFQLAASALQAEVGDLDLNDEEERKHRHYFLPEDYFPSWLIKRRGRDFLLQHCPTLHTELRGVPRSQAVLRFIKEASSLQDGAVTFYRMRRGCRFEISAVGSLCLSKLVYYTPSVFHSKHILRHLSDSHRLHINTRDAVSCVQQLEDMEACQFYKEAYICDTTRLTHRLQRLTSSMSDCSDAVEMTTAWLKEEEDEEVTEFELCVDEPQEFFVDDPAEVLWLAELMHAAIVGGPQASSHWAAVNVEMKQVLRSRDDEGVSVD
ncbi:FERM domain-containing protein 1 [Collichthys lucidus]|uniref:FERM domain-containing protein 1 n=1 Tax=Collichthys lucidus TaxID=240159 RepID=A0A4U5VMK9_COLLU|nr:FERM domain-containing protein 1 [Collichthys lucidus]